MYWNGLDTNENGVDVMDVSFDALPGHTLALGGVGGTVAADGSDQVIPGSILAPTDSSGAMHHHRPYTLDDGDMNSGTNPVDGIYLVALDVRMDALETSEPFFLVFGPPSPGFLPARNAAVAWVQERVDTLVFTGLPGDYNGDGTVDAADYLVWRKFFGQNENLLADGNDNDEIDTGDYTVWTEDFGSTESSGGGGGAVPEPGTIPCILVGLAVFCVLSRRRPLRNCLDFHR
jgi:hypothetical protein